MNKQPEVTARTRESFIEALWRLYRETPVDRIRIDTLAREAGYNRTTFYEYFTDIYDLLHQAEDELIQQYREQLRAIFPDGLEKASKKDIVKSFMTLFETCGDRIMTLTGEHGDTSFLNGLEQRATPMMLMILGTDIGKYTGYVISFVFNGIMGVLKHWYREGKSLPEEQVFSLIYAMLFNGAFQTVKGIKDGEKI